MALDHGAVGLSVCPGWAFDRELPAQTDLVMNRIILIATILIFATGGLTYSLQNLRPTPDKGADFAAIPYEQGNYFGDERRFDSASYEILQADTTTLRFFRGPDQTTLWLFVAYFSSQEYGSQIHSPRHCLPGGGWRIDGGVQPYQLTLSGSTFEGNRMSIVFREQRQLMLYWFETRTGKIRNEFSLKFDLMKNALMRSPTDAAIVRVTLPFLPGETIDAATIRAEQFLESFYPGIEKSLPFGN